MTVASETARQRHNGNGATTTFTTGFVFLANSHVRVIHTDSDDVDTEWTENTQYTLIGADTGSAGTVTTLGGYTVATGAHITIIRDVPFTQTLDADTLESLPATSVEDAYDKLWQAMGQLKEQLSRAYVSSETGDGGPPDGTIDVMGWSPEFAVVNDSARRVLQIVDWTGGTGTPPDTGQYVGATGLVDLIADGVDIRGATGANGAGSGDMLAANNLSEVTAATAFATIKQQATTSATGVVELATDAEALAKTDTARVLICSNLAALILDEDTMSSDSNAKVPTQQSVKAYVDSNAGIFASGTAMLFIQTSAPTGWTKSTTHNDKALRVVSGTASSGGSVNFSTLFARTGTDAVTLVQANLPNVTLSLLTTADAGAGAVRDSSDGAIKAASSTGATSLSSVPLGGSGTSFTPAIDCRVKYVDTIIATKD